MATDPQSIIGVREPSFGADPSAVAALAGRSIVEHRRHGVLATVKHFSALGACLGDSHLDLIDGTKTWRRDELLPYRTLLATSGTDAIMSTHTVHKKISGNDLPLTISRPMMDGVLRGELGFEGVLFTDDLGMGSIVRHNDLNTVVVESFCSGHDVLVFWRNAAASAPGSAPAHLPVAQLFALAVAGVQGAVESGRLTEARLKTSHERLRKLRGHLKAEGSRPPPGQTKRHWPPTSCWAVLITL